MPRTSTHKRQSRIKDLPLSSQPQEKLLAKGRHNLTDAELMAILLGTGSAKQNAVVMAEGLLRHFPLQKFPSIQVSDFLHTPGIGRVKASRIMAALEMGERIFAPAALTKIVIRTTDDALNQLKDIVGKKQEHLVVLYLNARYELLQKEVLALGSLNTTMIEPKEIFTPAVMSPCHAIIVAHNHPSGDPQPSEADLQFTKRIQEAGEIMGVTLLDHLIVAKNAYYSFKDGNQ